MLFAILTFLLMALAVMDVYYTDKIIKLGGSELNPFIDKLMEQFGAGWKPIKILVTVVGVVLAFVLSQVFGVYFMVAAVSIMAYVVKRNKDIYQRMK